MFTSTPSFLPSFIYFGAADHEEIEALPSDTCASERLKQCVPLVTVAATTTTTKKKLGLSDINMQVSTAPHPNGEQLPAKNKRQDKQMMSWEEF